MFSVCKNKGSGFKTLIYDIFNYACLAFADRLLDKALAITCSIILCVLFCLAVYLSLRLGII